MRFSRLTVFVCLFLCALALFGQGDRGTITGTVSDPAGAVVANAPIEVRNTATGAATQVASTETGNYTLANLPAGDYQLSVQVPGFKRYVRQNLTVQVAQTLRVDIVLEVGAASESVTVTAETSLLKTESGELSHNVESTRLNNLPVLGIGGGQAGSSGVRNPLAVTQLAPGTSWRPNSDVRVNGAPSNTQSIRVEGMESGNSFLSYAQAQTQPSVDAIQELSIQTSNYAAEYGQAGGGVFNFTMKSGTNQFHGSAYDYMANDILNAGQPWTNNGKGEHIRTPVRRHNWGFTAGGPIFIPKIYDGHDKSFFFFGFERFQEKQNVSAQATTVPTLAYRAGDFSNTLTGFNASGTDALGRVIPDGTIYDPQTTRPGPNGVLVRDPFVGNKIPASRMDPVALKIQSLLPLPTNSTAFLNNGIYPYISERHTPIPSLKLDHNLSDKAKLSFYWSKTATESQYSPQLGQSEGFPVPVTAARGTFIYSHVERLNFDYTLQPTLLLHLGVGFQHNDFNDTAPVTDYNAAASLGLNGATVNRQFPKIDYLCLTGSGTGTSSACSGRGGSQSLGPAGQGRTILIKPSANTSVTWVKANHTYKIGGEFKLEGYPTATFTNATGYYSFAPNTTSGVGIAYPGNAQTGLPVQGLSLGGRTIGFPYAAFLLGLVDNGNITQVSNIRGGKNFLGLFVQDTWKVTRKLTLDYGLRWDWGSYTREQYGRGPSFSPTTANPAAGGHPGASIFEATCNCQFSGNYPYAIGPRLGIAYQIDSKTVLRAGFGVSYFTASGGTVPVAASNNPYASSSVGEAATTLAQGAPFTPTWPVLSAGLFPINGANGGLTGAPNLIDQNSGRPARQMMWSVGLQREIGRNVVVEASYVGNRGNWWRAGGLLNVNAITSDILAKYGLDLNNAADRAILLAPIGSSAAGRFQNKLPYSSFPTSQTVAQSLRPFPQFQTITAFGAPLGKTWYDSLQAKVTKRFSHGLDFTYTFSFQKELTLGVESDNGGGLTVQPQFNDVSNRDLNKYISGFSQPFRNVLAANYTVPKASFFSNKYLSYALRDWQIGTVLQYSSGLPILAPRSTGNLNSLIFQSTFVDRVPGVDPFTVDLNCHCFDPTTTFVLNPKAWSDPGSTGRFGTAAAYYNDYRQQRRPNESMSFGRNFQLRERMNLQVRVEFSNIFNRAQAANPTSTNVGSPQTTNAATGLTTGGFGWINVTSAAQPERQGTGVIRFSF